jgi:hypothetical protein
MIGLTREWLICTDATTSGISCSRRSCLHTNGKRGGARERRRRASLLGTEGVTWDVAWSAVFLASDESR